MAASKAHWMENAVKHPGAYGHHSVKQMEKDKAKGGLLGRRANFALIARRLHGKGQGPASHHGRLNERAGKATRRSLYGHKA